MNRYTGTSQRDETPAQQADRKWGDLLQELRVMQTGVQLTAGFLLTLPFQQRFTTLTDGQRGFYLVLVALTAVTTALVLAPVAAHRKVSGRHVKDRLVAVAHRLAQAALACVALLVVLITTFIFDVVVDLTTAIVVGATMALVAVVLIVFLPHQLTRDHDH